MTTDTEQLGISPTSASRISPINGRFRTEPDSRSTPIMPSTKFSTTFTAISITAIFSVCFSADTNTLPSSSSHAQCSRSQKP